MTKTLIMNSGGRFALTATKVADGLLIETNVQRAPFTLGPGQSLQITESAGEIHIYVDGQTDPELTFIRAWDAGKVTRVSDGKKSPDFT